MYLSGDYLVPPVRSRAVGAMTELIWKVAMPVGLFFADHQDHRSIHRQCKNRHTPDCGECFDPEPVPAKMIAPVLFSWIEEWRFEVRFGIDR